MAVGLMVFPGAQPSRNRNGGAVYAELRFYTNCTTIPKTVYSDEALTTPLSFPVVSDDAGRFPAIWADTAELYTVNWATADGQSITLDCLSASLAADAMILDQTEAALDVMRGIVAGYAGTVLYGFSILTADADPGDGLLRFDNDTLADVTEIYADNLDANCVSAEDWLDSFGVANDGDNRGTLTIRSLLDSSQFAVFYVSGDVVDGTGYRKIPVTWIDGSTRPANLASISVNFTAAGPEGIQGDPGTNGWTPILAVVADGERRVERVTGWTGGTGSPPASGVYVGPSGFVDTAAEATNIRGPNGPGTGDMLSSMNLSDVASVPDSRDNLGLGTAAVLDVGTAVGDVVQVQTGGKLPALDASDLTNVPPSIWAVNSQAGAYTILATDKGKALVYTGSSAVTWGVTASATLATGWWCSLNNAGTGIIILNPAGSETVDGFATIFIYPGETFFLRTNGSNLFTVARATRVLVEAQATVGASTAPLVFEAAFADAEAVTIDFEFTNISSAAAAGLLGVLKWGGSYQTGATEYARTVALNGTTSPGSAASISLGPVSSGARANGSARVNSPFATTAGISAVVASLLQSSSVQFSSTITTTQNAALEGVRFDFGGSNFNAGGSIRCYVNRE